MKIFWHFVLFFSYLETYLVQEIAHKTVFSDCDFLGNMCNETLQ